MSLRVKGLPNWTDEELAAQLRFGQRFAGSTAGMYEQILCEAMARILERTSPKPKKPRKVGGKG